MSNEKFKFIAGSLVNDKHKRKPVKYVQKNQSQSKFLILAGRKLKLQKENRWVNKTNKSTSTLTQKQKESLITDLLLTSDSRQILAQSMMSPIRSRLNYSSLARQVFTVQPLPEGAIPVFDSDNSSALSLNDLSSS